MGMNTLALARHFGALPLANVRAPDCIYFNWMRCRMIVYSERDGRIMGTVTVLLLIAAWNLGRQNFRGVDLTAAMLFVIALLGGATLRFLPGGSYVVQIPALLGATSLLLGHRTKRPVARARWGLLAAWPITYLFAPLAYLFVVNLGFNLASLGAVALLVALLVGSGWPLFAFLLPFARSRSHLT
jgi:hypothetical protein